MFFEKLSILFVLKSIYFSIPAIIFLQKISFQNLNLLPRKSENKNAQIQLKAKSY